MTIQCLVESVPKVPGIAFLSGGQTDLEATKNLNLISKINKSNFIMTFSYGRALQQSALKYWSKNIEDIKNTQKIFNHRAEMCSLASQGKWTEEIEKANKFIYIISPNRIKNRNFFKDLEEIFKSKKVKYFQLRLKNENIHNLIRFGKRIKKLCKKYKVKLIINDNVKVALKIGADGCHLGQADMKISQARKILKNKLLGVTCHNSIKLVKKEIKNQVDYIALGAFFKSSTKIVKYKAYLGLITKVKVSQIFLL